MRTVQLLGDLLVITPESGLDVIGADRWGRLEGSHHRNGAMLVQPSAGSAARDLARATALKTVGDGSNPSGGVDVLRVIWSDVMDWRIPSCFGLTESWSCRTEEAGWALEEG